MNPTFYNDPNLLHLKLEKDIFLPSNGAFNIYQLGTNKPIFQVKTNSYNNPRKKTLYSNDNLPIYKLSGKVISLREKMYIRNAKTDEIAFTLCKKGLIPPLGSGTVYVWKGNRTDLHPDFIIKGGAFKRNFYIQDASTGNTICAIQKKLLSMSNLFQDTFILTAEQGIDIALMIILSIAVNDSYHD